MNRLENLDALKMAWNLVEDWSGRFELNYHPDRGEACCWHAEFDDYDNTGQSRRKGSAWAPTAHEAILTAHSYIWPAAVK